MIAWQCERSRGRVLDACSTRAFLLEQRTVVDGRDDAAVHATNVALDGPAAMVLEARHPEPTCIEITGRALLHDAGDMLLPREIQCVPEPLLDARTKQVFRTHTTEGALALMAAGCPELWVAVALEHHRGVDGLGYPALGTKDPPHDLVRVVALASFLDCKRTRIDGKAAEPDDALRQALALEDRYFGRPLVGRAVRALGAYPPGTVVELSYRAPALVTQVNGGDPWRPQVQLLRGAETGGRIELRELVSAEARYELSIVRAIAPPLFVLGDVHVEAGDVALAPSPVMPVWRTPAPARRSSSPPAVHAQRHRCGAPRRRARAAAARSARAVRAATDVVGRARRVLHAHLLEFLSHRPPAPKPSAAPARPSAAPATPTGRIPVRAPAVDVVRKAVSGAYSSLPPSIVEVARKPMSGAYSSVVPAAVKPSSKPPAPASASKMPVARAGATSSKPPRGRIPVVIASAAEIAAARAGSIRAPASSSRSSTASRRSTRLSTPPAYRPTTCDASSMTSYSAGSWRETRGRLRQSWRNVPSSPKTSIPIPEMRCYILDGTIASTTLRTTRSSVCRARPTRRPSSGPTSGSPVSCTLIGTSRRSSARSSRSSRRRSRGPPSRSRRSVSPTHARATTPRSGRLSALSKLAAAQKPQARSIRLVARRQAALEELQKRFAESALEAKRHAATAARARAMGDVMGALEAYEMALTYAPRDAALRAAQAELQSATTSKLGETHEKQALLEEEFGQWAEAARSWAAVLAARPTDEKARERLANARARAGLPPGR